MTDSVEMPAQLREWLRERQSMREANRLVLADLAFHLERMEALNEDFYLSPRSVEVFTTLAKKLKPWRTGL